MPLLATKYFGTVPYEDADRFLFPEGLPGYEDENGFVLLNLPGKRPLVFLQSTATAELCFLAFPILVVDPEYALGVSFEDLVRLELPPERRPEIAAEVLVLALLSLQQGRQATANLMAPIVANLKTRRALQAIRSDSKYSHQHAIPGLAQEQPC